MADKNGNGNGNVATLQAIQDATAYPILTEDIGGAYSGGSGITGGVGTSQGSSAPIGRIVEGALRDVLAWRPKANDPKAFAAALTQAFNLREVEGHTEWDWVPRSYAVDADLGAVTGAQASIYARAKSFLSEVLPLLDGLAPLRSDADQEDVEAIRAIVENGLSELVNELGQEGGPRPSRVDGFFIQLLGDNDKPMVPERVGGQLGLLRNRFGLKRGFVNTIPEEEVLTNYLIIVDGVRALRFTWESQKGSFDRQGADVFLGTQAVLLSRSLGVIAESVQEACAILDSVFLGAAERQVTRLELTDDTTNQTTTLYLGELLSWVNEFATVEGPRLIRDGGKDGVIHAFVPTISKLASLTYSASQTATKTNPVVGPAALRTSRVGRALSELATQCKAAENLARQLNRDEVTNTRPSAGVPVVETVTPAYAYAGDQNVTVTLLGDRLQAPNVSWRIGDLAVVPSTRHSGSLLLRVTIPADAAAGSLPIEAVVDNATKPTSQVFEIRKPPHIESVSIRSQDHDQNSVLFVGGRHLDDVEYLMAKLVWTDSGKVKFGILKVSVPAPNEQPRTSFLVNITLDHLTELGGAIPEDADVTLWLRNFDGRTSEPFLLEEAQLSAFLKPFRRPNKKKP